MAKNTLNYKITQKGNKIFFRKSVKGIVDDLSIIEEVYSDNFYNLKKLNIKPKTIIDIGAQIGSFSIFASEIFHDYKPRIIAFEPIESNYELLLKNADQNHDLNIFPIKKAIAGTYGFSKIYVNPGNYGGHSIYNDFSNEYEVVESTTLSKVITDFELTYIDILKIDCEGSEFEILKSLSNIDFKKIGCILIEIHETTNSKIQFCAKDILDILSSNNFEIKITKTIYYSDEGLFLGVIARNMNL